jgi:PAS domain S-box-containing protein
MAKKICEGSQKKQRQDMGSGIRIIDSKFNVLFSNSTADSFLGECTNRKCHSFDSGNSGKPCPGCHYLELLDGKKLVKQAVISLPGSGINAEFICTPVKDSHGNVVGAVEIVRTANSGIRTEHEWKNALDTISAAVCVLDKDARIIKCNAAMSALTGRTIEEIEGTNCCKVMHGIDYPIPDCPVERMKKTKRRESSELLVKGRWFNVTAEPIFDKNGKISRAVHVIRDITEQKKAEEALRISEERFRNVFENSPVGKSITSFEGVVNPNTALCNMLGYTREELSRLNWKEITPAEDIAHTERYLMQLKSGKKKALNFTKRYIKKDGSIIWAELYTILYTDSGGKPLYYITSVVDITERKRVEDALKKSEERLTLALKGSNDGWWDWDLINDTFFFSPRWWNIIGYAPDELPPGRETWEKLTHPADKEEVTRVYLDALKNGAENFEVESRRKHKKGHWVPILTRAHIQKDTSGKPVRITGTTTDLTQRKNMEEALRSSEEKYRLIFENAREGIVLIGTDGKIVAVNKHLPEIIGVHSEDFRGKSMELFLPALQKSNEDAFNTFRGILSGKTVLGRELSFIRPDGNKIHVSITATLVKKDNAPFGVLAMIQDITELKQAGEELAKSKELLQNVFNSASEMILSVDQNLVPTAWNPAALKLTGFRRTDVIGKTLSAVKGLEPLAGVAEETLAKGQNQITEAAIRTSDDRQRLLNVSASLLKDTSSRPIGVILVCRDITGQLDMTKSLSKGNAYILNDREKETLMKSCETFHERGYECLVVTREDPEKVIVKLPSARVLWLTAAKSEKYPSASDPEQITAWLHKQFSRESKKAVFIDRTDYLINTHGFDKTLNLIYLLNDHVMKSDNFAFVHVNTEMLTLAQSKILLLELRPFPSSTPKELTLPKKNLELLQFVRSRTLAHTDVYFKDISKNFDISKVTTKKIINELLSQNLITVRKVGRLKTVELTDAGKELLSLSRVTSL